MITDYTSYAEIRAVLGVSEDDLEDETLALELYDNYLTMELEEVNIDLPSTYETTSALASPSAAQTRFLQATRMFAAYAIAKQLTASLPLFAAKQVTDSKAGISRFDNPYRDTIKTVLEEYSRMKNRLVQAIAGLSSSTSTRVTRTLVGVSSPDIDPVIGS